MEYHIQAVDAVLSFKFNTNVNILVFGGQSLAEQMCSPTEFLYPPPYCSTTQKWLSNLRGVPVCLDCSLLLRAPLLNHIYCCSTAVQLGGGLSYCGAHCYGPALSDHITTNGKEMVIPLYISNQTS